MFPPARLTSCPVYLMGLGHRTFRAGTGNVSDQLGWLVTLFPDRCRIIGEFNLTNIRVMQFVKDMTKLRDSESKLGEKE